MATVELGRNLTILLAIIVLATLLGVVLTLAASAGILRDVLAGLAFVVLMVLILLGW